MLLSVADNGSTEKPKRKQRRYRPMAERRARKGLNRGKPAFEPSIEQRFMVTAMASMRMTWDEMRIGIRNPATNAAISKTCFAKVFQQELAEGPSHLKRIVTSKYYSALGKGEPWAIKLGLRNRFRWALESGGEPDNAVGDGDVPSLNVTFVLPDRRKPEPPPLDVTPQSAPDYSRKALPAPPERVRGPLGWLEERPPGKDGWMK
jgi:hypothetical protein